MKKIFAILFLIFTGSFIFAQVTVPVIRSNKSVITFSNGPEIFNNGWTITPSLKPDTYSASVKGNSTLVRFVTDVDSISFNVKPGDQYDFIILLNGKDSAYTRITGKPFVEMAVFTDAYKKAHTNKTFVEVPEVYEMVNVAFAISDIGQKDPYIVYKRSKYYDEVMKTFRQYAQHPFVHAMDTLLQRGRYTQVKMDAYAFEFDEKGSVSKSKIYNSIAGEDNSLDAHLKEMQDFASAIGFRKFFADHHALYTEQVKYYRDTLNTDEMRKWLNGHFPSTSYHSFKIIFTPLVAYNQSATWFDNNGFKEMQAHVNFPWPHDFTAWTGEATKVMRGNIVFTEINHAFINPEADKPAYLATINKVFADLSKWAQKGKPAEGYNSPYSCFNEYMNWVLVSLRYIDYAPAADRDKMIAFNGTNMKERRGFTKFPEFNEFVTMLYKNRQKGETIADLYPKILDWCAEQ